MKKLVSISLIATLSLGILWSCSKSNQVGTPGSLTLKQSLNQSAMDLNTAVSRIKSSPAYGILTEGATKAAMIDTSYRVNISLNLIKGVYDYKPAVRPDKRGIPILHFFAKTADNNKMIVRMPLQKAKNPWTLVHFTPADSTLANNFSITVSDYHNNYNNRFDYDYLLNAALASDSTQLGNLNIQSIVNPNSGAKYSSQFVFNGGYTVGYNFSSGDSTSSSFSISGNGKILYQEKLLFIRNDSAQFGREFQYTLTIGDVEFMRSSKNDSTQVFVNGVLQPNATIKIVDTASDSEPSVVKHRDIQVTFQDGTSTTISALIGKSISNISTLYASLHQVYFAADVVDWIAYDIYFQQL